MAIFSVDVVKPQEPTLAERRAALMARKASATAQPSKTIEVQDPIPQERSRPPVEAVVYEAIDRVLARIIGPIREYIARKKAHDHWCSPAEVNRRHRARMADPEYRQGVQEIASLFEQAQARRDIAQAHIQSTQAAREVVTYEAEPEPQGLDWGQKVGLGFSLAYLALRVHETSEARRQENEELRKLIKNRRR